MSGYVDESRRVFLKAEKALAEYLAAENSMVVALSEKSFGRGADALVDGFEVEFKSLQPGATDATVRNVVNNSIRRGGQARRIIIDARQSGLSQEQAAKGLARARPITRGRLDSVRIIGDTFDLLMDDFV